MPAFEQITVPGRLALTELDRLRAEHPATGLYPVLLGEADELETLLEDMEGAEPAAVTLGCSSRIWRFAIAAGMTGVFPGR